MKTIRTASVCAALAFVTIGWSTMRAAPAGAETLAQSASSTPAPAKSLSIESLAWMSGHWETTAGPVTIDEHWTDIAGASMLGVSRTVGNGKMVFFEFLRLETRGDAVYYVAQPGGGEPTPFKLVKVDGQSATFENPEHDFPKRILYRREADGGLFARVEGDGKEPEKAQEFHYKPRKGK